MFQEEVVTVTDLLFNGTALYKSVLLCLRFIGEWHGYLCALLSGCHDITRLPVLIEYWKLEHSEIIKCILEAVSIL